MDKKNALSFGVWAIGASALTGLVYYSLKDARPGSDQVQTTSEASTAATSLPTATATATTEATAVATAEVSATPSAVPSTDPTATPEPTGSMTAAAPTATASATASTTAGDSTGEAAQPKAKKALPLPKPPNGIMPAGEADKILKVGQKARVALIDAGQAPQSDLTYAFAKGSQGVGMRMNFTMGLSMGDKTVPAVTTPQMVMLFDFTVADKNADGDFPVTGKILELTAVPKGQLEEQVAKALRPSLSKIAGLGIAQLVTEKGNVHDIKLTMPPGMPPGAEQVMSGMNQSFESLVAPLPDEPIGIGGRWQAVTRVFSSGADLVQFATYTLKAKDGTKLTVDSEITQFAAKGDIQAPGMPATLKARLLSFKSKGSGTTRIDTTNIAPESSKVNTSSSMQIEVSSDPGSPAEKQSIDISMGLELYRPTKK